LHVPFEAESRLTETTLESFYLHAASTLSALFMKNRVTSAVRTGPDGGTRLTTCVVIGKIARFE
jgi:hypothetical protein